MDTRLNDRDWILNAYATGRSLESIAGELGVARLTVRRRLVKYGATIRPADGSSMKGRPKTAATRARMAEARRRYWASRANRKSHRLKISQAKLKGRNSSKGPRGYRRVIDFSRPRGTMLEHRFVMEQALGRKLLRSEIVHHKDGNRANNDLTNLELWSKSHPPGQRVRDKLAWAREIIRLYAGLPDDVG